MAHIEYEHRRGLFKRSWVIALPDDWTPERYTAALVSLLNGPCVGDAAILAAAFGGAELIPEE